MMIDVDGEVENACDIVNDCCLDIAVEDDNADIELNCNSEKEYDGACEGTTED